MTRATGDDGEDASGAGEEDITAAEAARRANSAINVKKGGGARRADSTDAVATFLTRRFGIAGGLAWLGVLTFGVVSEQLKTRREVREARENTKDVADAKEVTTASGLRYTDLRVGGGEMPRNGYLLAANVVATIDGTGDVVLDTRRTNRQVIFTFGKPQGPFTAGVMEAVGGMRQVGHYYYQLLLVLTHDITGREADRLRAPGVGLRRRGRVVARRDGTGGGDGEVRPGADASLRAAVLGGTRLGRFGRGGDDATR